jgi:hypothetical protein
MTKRSGNTGIELRENDMVNIPTRTLDQIRSIGLEVLSRELGPVGMVRFLQQFETGQGDYSVDRHQWLDQLSVEEILQQMKQKRKIE